MAEAVTCRPVTSEVHIRSNGVYGKVARNRIFSKYTSFPLPVLSCQCFILIIHLKTALIRMTSMQSLSAFKEGCAFLEIMDHCKERQSLFFCVCERVEF